MRDAVRSDGKIRLDLFVELFNVCAGRMQKVNPKRARQNRADEHDGTETKNVVWPRCNDNAHADDTEYADHETDERRSAARIAFLPR